MLLYKVVDGIRSDKIRDALLSKVVEITLEKAINICQTEEITKMQMKKMNSEKAVGGILRNRKWKKAQKRKQESDNRYRRKKIRRDQLRPWMGRNVNFVDKSTNQESVVHIDRNATSAKRRITGQPAVWQRK